MTDFVRLDSLLVGISVWRMDQNSSADTEDTERQLKIERNDRVQMWAACVVIYLGIFWLILLIIYPPKYLV